MYDMTQINFQKYIQIHVKSLTNTERCKIWAVEKKPEWWNLWLLNLIQHCHVNPMHSVYNWPQLHNDSSQGREVRKTAIRHNLAYQTLKKNNLHPCHNVQEMQHLKAECVTVRLFQVFTDHSPFCENMAC